MTFRLLITTVSALLLPGLLAAQTKNAYPMLMSLQPTAAQIGTQTEHELHARYNLAGATSIMVSGEGVQAESIPNEKDKPDAAERNDVTDSRCKLRMTVAADAQVGVRDFRVMTPHGVSTLGQVVLVRDPLSPKSKGMIRLQLPKKSIGQLPSVVRLKKRKMWTTSSFMSKREPPWSSMSMRKDC